MSSSPITIQYDLRPAYYDDFHCLAGGCHWNCCKGWRISFDKKDYLSLKHDKYSPELGDQMEHCLQRIRKNSPIINHYAEIRLRKDGVCPLQREDGLCELQVEKGPQALPLVCKVFPRIGIASPSNFFERSLSLGCESVVSLLWNLPEGIDYRSDPLPQEEWKISNIPPDSKMMPYFQEVRSLFIDYLQDRRFPLPSRILMIGLAMQELQSEEDIPRWLEFAKALPESPNINKLLEIGHSESILHMFLSNNLKVLMNISSSDLDALQIQVDLLNLMGIRISTDGALMKINFEAYIASREKYNTIFANRDYFMENIMVALFFHLRIPALDSLENFWKSYVNFCNLYSFYRFITIYSCRDGITNPKEELFRLVVMVSRSLLHNKSQQTKLQDELFANDSTTLAHMAVLLSE